MYELLVACKYLIPRRKQLSVSLISLISALVIALVVWLILVFFSVTNGLEKNWIQKLVSLTAPVRMTPTKAYYDSYYYRIDALAEASDYTAKSLREKLLSELADPYDSEIDEEIPRFWQKPDLDREGNVKDLVKEAFAAADALGLQASPFETGVATLRLNLQRENLSTMSQSAYVASLDPSNRDFPATLFPLCCEDVGNMQRLQQPAPRVNSYVLPSAQRALPEMLPKEGSLVVVQLKKGEKILYGVIAERPSKEIFAEWNEAGAKVEIVEEDFSQPPTYPLYFAEGTRFAPEGDKLIAQAQGISFEAELPLELLQIEAFEKEPIDPALRKEKGLEEVYLPKPFKEAGVLVGDRGELSYMAPTLSAMQEMRIPVVVKGFYDQGIVPIGGRLVMARPELVSAISSSYDAAESSLLGGIDVRFAEYSEAEEIKEKLQQQLQQRGVAAYWNVETFREYSFTKDLLLQLSSEKNLFSLISVVIIIVACSNIISMLIILVNDKKVEIGILRSMGAKPHSIAAIFGFCGLIMGGVGSLIGVLFALLTLKNIDFLIHLISTIQGHALFNKQFFGEVIPSEMSGEALAFVTISTIAISLVSGVVPALKACLLRPSQILRSQ